MIFYVYLVLLGKLLVNLVYNCQSVASLCSFAWLENEMTWLVKMTKVHLPCVEHWLLLGNLQKKRRTTDTFSCTSIPNTPCNSFSNIHKLLFRIIFIFMITRQQNFYFELCHAAVKIRKSNHAKRYCALLVQQAHYF